ncbi:hypothetical protein EMCRGX_G031938 [Ephydatia muelleri]
MFLRRQLSRCVSAYSTYVQGQYSAPNVREYFYYIDHQGQLFLDDAKMKNFITCFKDVATYGQTPPPPGEHFAEMLSYGGAGNLLTARFDPEKLCMLPTTGRVYYGGLERLGGVGLVKSSLASELAQFFVYNRSGVDSNSPPVRITWRGKTTELDRSVLNRLHQVKVA